MSIKNPHNTTFHEMTAALQELNTGHGQCPTKIHEQSQMLLVTA